VRVGLAAQRVLVRKAGKGQEAGPGADEGGQQRCRRQRIGRRVGQAKASGTLA
jgi:hypothetical protein